MPGEFRCLWLPTALALLTFGVWQAEGFTGSPQPKGLVLALQANKESYAPGEPILLTLQVVNQSPQPVILQFRTAQRFDLVIQDAQGRRVWQWSRGEMFAQVIGEETVPSGEPLRYRITVRDRFPLGTYTVVGMIVADDGPMAASVTLRIA